MAGIQDWLAAARIRTLPLALSSIIMGGGLALERAEFDISVYLWTILTAVLLQVLSNFANDLGDHLKGTDDHTRVGPQRATQSGTISARAMRHAVFVMALLALISGSFLLYHSGMRLDLGGMSWLTIGLLAILAAIRYTMGTRAYGYRGFGDLAVFLFFGLVGVLGSYHLHSLSLPKAMDVLLASSIGFLSAAVLNLNNMRDAVPDQSAGKITMAVQLGKTNSRRYHFALIGLGMLCTLSFILLGYQRVYDLYPLATLPLFVHHLYIVTKTKTDAALDPELKRVALGTFFMAMLFFVSKAMQG